MFPLNSNQAYIKDTGERTTLGDVIGSGGGGGTSDYSKLSNKPSINGVTLSGNKTTANLGISYTDLTNTPTIPNINYSETEQDTGLTWIDGEKLYQKTIVGTMPEVTIEGTYATKNIQHGITNIGSVRFITNAYAVDSSGGVRQLPYLLNSGTQTKLSLFDTYIQSVTGTIAMSEAPLYVTVQYTKATT